MNRRQLLTTAAIAALFPALDPRSVFAQDAASGFVHVFYGGNGTVAVDSGLHRVGTIFGVSQNGDLRWYRYSGNGESDRSGALGWAPNSGNRVGNGWANFLHVMGCGDGVVMAIQPSGELLWYQYDGNGEDDVSGASGWHANSGNPIGRGWQNFQHVFATPQQGPVSSARLTVWAVAQNGDLLWYSYSGNGESDITGAAGWHPNSGNAVGNGWSSFHRIAGIGSDIMGVHDSGDLLWYSYSGDGESDVTGSLGWNANSGNVIGNGWLGMRHVFGGSSDSGGFHQVVYGVNQNGDLHWYAYDGHGEADQTGALGWRVNSGNVIGNGW
ncbi:MAG: tachylectin-related carbohydrate-binding protein [Thermomicrobiales bacterium]